MRRLLLVLSVSSILVFPRMITPQEVSCSDYAPPKQQVLTTKELKPKSVIVTASWYGTEHNGRRMANGQRFDAARLTAAHRTLRLGTMVRVTEVKHGRSVTVKITDRGPFRHGRMIDLSHAAASRIGIVGQGVARVRIEVVARPHVPRDG